jgi:hypothetical protein
MLLHAPRRHFFCHDRDIAGTDIDLAQIAAARVHGAARRAIPIDKIAFTTRHIASFHVKSADKPILRDQSAIRA